MVLCALQRGVSQEPASGPREVLWPQLTVLQGVLAGNFCRWGTCCSVTSGMTGTLQPFPAAFAKGCATCTSHHIALRCPAGSLRAALWRPATTSHTVRLRDGNLVPAMLQAVQDKVHEGYKSLYGVPATESAGHKGVGCEASLLTWSSHVCVRLISAPLKKLRKVHIAHARGGSSSKYCAHAAQTQRSSTGCFLHVRKHRLKS